MDASIVLIAAEESERSVLMPAVNELVWGTLAFVIFFAVMWKYAIPRANKALADRTANIEGKLEKAEADRAEAADLLSEYQLQMSEARAEAASIRDDARAQGETIRAQLRADAEVEAQRRLAQADLQIKAERDRAMSELRADVGTLSVDLASRIVGESLSSDDAQRNIVNRFLADLESGSSRPRGAQE